MYVYCHHCLLLTLIVYISFDSKLNYKKKTNLLILLISSIRFIIIFLIKFFQRDHDVNLLMYVKQYV